MREKINTIFYNLANQCKRFDNIEEQILLQLHDKPACVQIETLVNEYEALHHHDYYEILYIEKGNVTYLLHEQTYNLKAGDLILIPPTSLHRLVSFNSTISSRFILLFSSKFINKFSTSNTRLLKAFDHAKNSNYYKISITENIRPALEKSLKQASEIMLNNNYGMDLEYIARFIKIIIILNSISNEQDNTYLPNNNLIIDKITEYIDLNIANKILIEDIANHLALSVSRVSHIFKQETGTSILKYINKKRMMLAKELIRQGDQFFNIANKCGFQDYTSFFRAFKKEYNLTPGEYLKAVNLFQD